jgi:outer membrane protein
MKNILTFILAAVLMSISVTALPQKALKLGHVDINELMSALPQRDSAAAILDKESKELQSTYEEMTVEYNKLYDDYEKGLPKYSDLIKKTKETELMDKQKRLQEFEQNATSTLQKRNTELLQPILDKILKAVEKVATDSAFTYILDVSKGSVVYSSKESRNMNPLVLKILKP